MLSLSNPQNITSWVGMSGTIIGICFLNPEPKHLLIFFAGFVIAQVCWCFFFAAVSSISGSSAGSIWLVPSFSGSWR